MPGCIIQRHGSVLVPTEKLVWFTSKRLSASQCAQARVNRCPLAVITQPYLVFRKLLVLPETLNNQLLARGAAVDVTDIV